jgi:hypothetical protein
MNMSDITKIRVRGVEINFNWFDMDSRARYAAANDTLQRRLADIDAAWDSLTPEQITGEAETKHFTALCDACHDFFRDLFDADTADQIFQGKRDYFACMDAIASLVTAKERQGALIESLANSPKLNDATDR